MVCICSPRAGRVFLEQRTLIGDLMGSKNQHAAISIQGCRDQEGFDYCSPTFANVSRPENIERPQQRWITVKPKT